jgi:hypothetical protein
MTLMRTVLVLAFVLALIPSPAAAQVDDWRVLHVGLQSGASVDTDGDGKVNSWYTCKQRGNSKKAHCQMSALYDKWQVDMTCFESKVEAWTDHQIDVVQEQVFIETSDVLRANPYEFAWNGWADAYDFESYDVVMVWTGYTQALGFDGGTWNGVVGGYSFIALYGMAGVCEGIWPAGVPEHEFVHAVTGLYMGEGWPVCGTYEYPYGNYGEWEGHHMILTNTFPETTCSSGIVSTGVPAEAWASGSWVDLR